MSEDYLTKQEQLTDDLIGAYALRKFEPNQWNRLPLTLVKKWSETNKVDMASWRYQKADITVRVTKKKRKSDDDSTLVPVKMEVWYN